MFLKGMNRLIIMVLLVTSVAVASEDAYTAVASFFAEYDKALENLSIKAQRVTSLSATEKMFTEEIEEYDCATYFLRTNSKGKIIAKVSEDGVAPRDYRFIGKQKWFEIISMTNKPYYGYTKNSSGYYLFWNKPIHVKIKKNTRFGGSISAKISMKKSFQKIADTKSVAFTVKWGKKTLFSNLSKDAQGSVTKPLSVGGLPVLTITYVPMGGDFYYPGDDSEEVHQVELKEPVEESAKSSVEAESKESASDNRIAASEEKSVEKKDADEASSEESKDTEKAVEEKRAGVFPRMPLIIFLSIFVVFLILVSKIISQRKHEKLLESIESDDF